MYNPVKIASDNGLYGYDNGVTIRAVKYAVNTTLSAWGARFNTKCLIGLHKFTYYTNPTYDLNLALSLKQNWIGLLLSGTDSNAEFHASVFCLSKGDLECS